MNTRRLFLLVLAGLVLAGCSFGADPTPTIEQGISWARIMQSYRTMTAVQWDDYTQAVKALPVNGWKATILDVTDTPIAGAIADTVYLDFDGDGHKDALTFIKPEQGAKLAKGAAITLPDGTILSLDKLDGQPFLNLAIPEWY